MYSSNKLLKVLKIQPDHFQYAILAVCLSIFFLFQKRIEGRHYRNNGFT